MLFQGLKRSLGRHARLTGMASVGVLAAACMTTAVAVDDHEYGDDCEARPTCEVIGGDTVYVPECDREWVAPDTSQQCPDLSVCAWVDLVCPDSRKGSVKVYVNGNEIAAREFTDRDARQKVYFEIPNVSSYRVSDTINVTITVFDMDNDTRTSCEQKIKIVCGDPPKCRYRGEEVSRSEGRRPMHIYDVKPGDYLEEFEVCAKSRCGERARVEMISRPPFMEPAGHRKGSRGRWVCLPTKAGDRVEGGFAPGIYWAKFKCTDVHSGRYRILKVGYRYDPSEPEPEPCDDLPLCEVLDGSSITVAVDSTASITVCGSSTCDDCDVSISMNDGGPAYVSLDQEDVPGNDDGLCNSYMVAPGAADVGMSTATFTITDCNGAMSECSIEINVPAPLLACTENEDQFPNGSYDDASVIDAADCVDGFGVNLYGVLNAPVFMNGDVDYFRVVGLIGGETYTATIVAGLNSDNVFTDTMLGWVVADGVVVATDDNSGPLRGYSMVTFTADAEGVATLAVTGHGDDNFDGSMESGMPYEEYGFGGYMMSIRAEQGDVQPVERQADLNGDGTVNTADLGLLISVFGLQAN